MSQFLSQHLNAFFAILKIFDAQKVVLLHSTHDAGHFKDNKSFHIGFCYKRILLERGPLLSISQPELPHPLKY